MKGETLSRSQKLIKLINFNLRSMKVLLEYRGEGGRLVEDLQDPGFNRKYSLLQPFLNTTVLFAQFSWF